MTFPESIHTRIGILENANTICSVSCSNDTEIWDSAAYQCFEPAYENDGHPSHTLPILNEHYNSEDKVNELIAGGDMKHLHTTQVDGSDCEVFRRFVFGENGERYREYLVESDVKGTYVWKRNHPGPYCYNQVREVPSPDYYGDNEGGVFNSVFEFFTSWDSLYSEFRPGVLAEYVYVYVSEEVLNTLPDADDSNWNGISFTSGWNCFWLPYDESEKDSRIVPIDSDTLNPFSKFRFISEECVFSRKWREQYDSSFVSS